MFVGAYVNRNGGTSVWKEEGCSAPSRALWLGAAHQCVLIKGSPAPLSGDILNTLLQQGVGAGKRWCHQSRGWPSKNTLCIFSSSVCWVEAKIRAADYPPKGVGQGLNNRQAYLLLSFPGWSFLITDEGWGAVSQERLWGIDLADLGLYTWHSPLPVGPRWGTQNFILFHTYVSNTQYIINKLFYFFCWKAHT